MWVGNLHQFWFSSITNELFVHTFVVNRAIESFAFRNHDGAFDQELAAVQIFCILGLRGSAMSESDQSI